MTNLQLLRVFWVGMALILTGTVTQLLLWLDNRAVALTITVALSTAGVALTIVALGARPRDRS